MNSKALSAKGTLLAFKNDVEEVLEQIFAKEILEAEGFTKYAVEYIKELANVTQVGGKRLRASFVYYSYVMHHGKDVDEILKIAAAIEMIHAFLLIEDDFMDLGDSRRGYPTIHKTYEKFHIENGFKKDPEHFGHSIAVNVGIIADHLAMNIVTNANFDFKLIKKALNQINRQIIITGHGQIHDILNEVRSDLEEEDILNVLYWKTGIYTYNNPIQTGAILAGANAEDLIMLSDYAIPGGVAFQIQDDILGSFGDEGKTGKPADSDIKEGKQTLLTHYAYQKANESQKKLMNEVIGNPQASDTQINDVRNIFVETGSLDYSKAKALDLVTRAKESLLKNKDVAGWDKLGVDYLEGIADYMIEREL